MPSRASREETETDRKLYVRRPFSLKAGEKSSFLFDWPGLDVLTSGEL